MKIGKAFGRYCEKDPQNGNNFETGWKFQKIFKILYIALPLYQVC